MKKLIEQNDSEKQADAFCYPQARISLIAPLQAIVSAAIDVSDGLLLDCSRMIRADQSVVLNQSAVLECTDADSTLEESIRAGDDYELLCAFPAQTEEKVKEICRTNGAQCTVIGQFVSAINDSSGRHIKLVDDFDATCEAEWLSQPWGWESFSNVQ